MANPHPTPAPLKFGATEAQYTIEAAHEGQTIVEIARQLKVARTTIWNHRQADKTFDAALENALVAGAYNRMDSLFEELDTYLRTPGASAPIAKARWDMLRSWLEKRFPAVFSPKQQIDMNITIDLAGSIQRAEQRSLAARQVIDLTAQAVTLTPDTISAASEE